MKYTATFEYLHGPPSRGVVTILDSNGNFAAAGRIECKSGRVAELYELGYTYASLTVKAKGGVLDRYSHYETKASRPRSIRFTDAELAALQRALAIDDATPMGGDKGGTEGDEDPLSDANRSALAKVNGEFARRKIEAET
jgi:hypothetical protein